MLRFCRPRPMFTGLPDRRPHTAAGQWMPVFSSPKSHHGQGKGEMELWALIFEKATRAHTHPNAAAMCAHAWRRERERTATRSCVDKGSFESGQRKAG